MAVLLFGLLIAAGLGLHLLARTAASLDGRLVADAVTGRTATLTSLAHAASLLGRSWVLIPFTVILGLGLMLLCSFRLRACGPLLAVLGAELLQHVLKGLVQRPRPAVLHLEHVTGSSFPSGHATESSAVAVALFLLAHRRPRREQIALGLILIALAAAVGASRVYLRVHYPTDVVAGMLLGAAWGTVAAWCTGAMEEPSEHHVSDKRPTIDLRRHGRPPQV